MHLSVSLLSFRPQHRERAVHSSTVLQKHCEMCFSFSTKCVIAGLLLSLAGAVVTTEAKTYTKPISKMSDLGNDVNVIVVKGATLIAQYICHKGNCTCTPNTAGQLTEQSGYLVLTMQNISQVDRFDAFKWDKSVKIDLLNNFTLDEVLRTSAAPDLTEGGLNPSITQTVPPTSTTPTLAEDALNQRHLDPPNKTDPTKVLIGVALTLAAVVLLVVIARAIAFFRRRSCDPAPNQHDGNSMEMQPMAAPV